MSGRSRRKSQLLTIALAINLAPRKLGSLEDWLLSFAREAARRGHRLTIFGNEPVHPTIRRELDLVKTDWATLDELTQRPFAAVRRLARDFDVLHLNLFAPRAAVAWLAYAAWPARVVFVDHFSDDQSVTAKHRALVRKLLDVLVSTRIASYVGVSDYVRDRARSRFGRSGELVETIHGGVDAERFAPAERPSPRPHVNVICVANLIPEKGVDVLLRSVARIDDPRLRLTVVGDGPEDKALRRLALELDLGGRVTFSGLRDDVDRLLRTADIFVHPAVWQEAFGLTVTEAMSSGCAVVASRVGALPELIVDGENGLLVPPGDVDALVAALRRLIGDPTYRAVLTRNARVRVTERFRIETSVARHLDRCEDLAVVRPNFWRMVPRRPRQG